MTLPPNIILVGFMGSGKTVTGKELSKILGFRFWDMDQWIEDKTGEKIPALFEKKGEKFFREQEGEAVQWLAQQKGQVASTGGGAWLSRANREILLTLGWCVWLKVTPEEAWKRVGVHIGQRPLLSRSDEPLVEIKSLLHQREPFYAQAHAHFETNGRNPSEVALEILESLKKSRPFDLPEL